MQDKFNFFIPATLVKGTTPGQEMKIKGICSSESVDTDGETLIPAGYDLRPLLETGFLNYNHQANKTAAAIIGEPTKAEIINNGKDLYIEGFLYADSEEAKAVYKLATMLEKNSSKRRLGFSIEGKALERGSDDKDHPLFKRITKAKITGVAITAMPKNPNTLLSIMKGEYSEPFIEDELDKSMTAEAGDGVTSKESVEGGIKNFDKLQSDKKAEEAKTCSKCHSTRIEDGECLDCGKKLKKSEVYDRILTKYKDYIQGDIQKAKQIYQLTQEFNTKLYNMENNNEVISKALDNCFSFIDSQIELIKGEESEETSSVEETTDDVVKSEEAVVVENEDTAAASAEEIVKSDETVTVVEDTTAELTTDTVIVKSDEVAVQADEFDNLLTDFVKGQLSSGLDSEDVIDNLVMKGFDAEISTNIVESVLAQVSEFEKSEEVGELAEENETSEEAPVVEQEINKGESNNFVGFKNDLIKGFEDAQVRVIGEFQTRFEALGRIVKSQADELNEIKSQNIELVKGLRASQEAVQRFATTSQGVKSVTKISAAPVERFQTIQKSMTGKEQFSLSKADDVNELTSRLNLEFDTQIQKGGPRNEPLANAIFELSVAKGLDRTTLNRLNPTLIGMNIEIVN